MASATPGATSIRGFYGPSSVADGSFMVYLTEETKLPIGKGWMVSDLPGITGNVYIQTYNSNVYGDVVVNPGPPAISFPYVSNAVVYADMPNAVNVPSSIVRLTLSPPTLTSNTANTANATTTFGLYDPRLFDASKVVGDEAPLRDLSSNVQTSEGINYLTTVTDRGAGTGALTALAAIGPQEKYVFGGQSLWLPQNTQHTPFTQTQRVILPYSSTTSGFLGQTVEIPIKTKEGGDLISNMYFQCSLPALPIGYSYCELVGRAIFKKVEFLIDGIVYETIDSDWYVIRDQLFLDADEKLGMYKTVSAGYIEGQTIPGTNQLNLIIPLEFFFCRRHTHGTRIDERIEKPFFPMCALLNSVVSVRFTFNPPAWITNTPLDENGKRVDIMSPKLLVEEIYISPEERIYYRTTPLTFQVPCVWNEAVQPYTNGATRVNLTANFPVSMIVWFVRNNLYETQNANFYNSRYAYGYTTDYIASATPVTFFNGASIRYIDTIEYATLYLNNQNILSNFPGGLYYTFKQPMDHGLSIPTKNIYMYCFSDEPHVYNPSGTLDFRTLNAQTTHLDIKFKSTYASQIASQFQLHVYYYGYKTLNVSNGRASLS